jgi:SAM-dependent methyltransferase
MKEPSTFNPDLFKKLKVAEENHFWFDVRRKWIFGKLSRALPPPARILEVGCGTGNVSSFLSDKGYDVTGCELYSEAIGNASGLFDVIEHFDDDISLLAEASRVVRSGGIVAFTVPALEALWSLDDEVSLHKRRYGKERCYQIIADAGLRPILVEYIFMSLYIPMKFIRKKGEIRDNPFRINNAVNIMLKSLFDIERLLSRTLPLPIGTSIIALARKP